MMRRHSRIFFLLASLLVLFTANAYAAAGPEKLSCPKNDKISAVVRQSWHEEGYDRLSLCFAATLRPQLVT